MLILSLKGVLHYALAFDLNSDVFKKLNVQSIDMKLSMECGNDQVNGMLGGSADPVPDGGMTLMLFGMALSGMGMLARRFSKWRDHCIGA